jgi:hypothetical protein
LIELINAKADWWYWSLIKPSCKNSWRTIVSTIRCWFSVWLEPLESVWTLEITRCLHQ